MKRLSRLDYAYAVGRVRVLERNLVEKAVFIEATEENDFNSALKIIYDAGDFSEDLVETKNSDELDEFLDREERDISLLMDKILLEKDITKIFLKENELKEAVQYTENISYSFIRDYIRHKIDLGNIKIFFRVKYKGLSREKFECLILKGGFLDERILLENFDLTFGEIGDKLRASPYQDLWNNSVDILEERETFVELERGMEDFLMTYLRRAKFIVFGPEPIFAYGLAKRRELNLVRLLGVGKINRIPVDFLKERISETYV